MKIRNILFTPILFIVMISGLFSCGVDRWPEVCGRNRTGYMDRQRDASGIPLVQRNAFSYSNQYFWLPQNSSKVIYTTLDKNYSYIDTLNKVQSPEYGLTIHFIRMQM